MPYQKIYDKWTNEEQPEYEKLGSEVVELLKDLLYESGMHADLSYRTKDIVSILKKIKKKNETSNYKFEDLTDKLGVRIICNYIDDITTIDKIIHNNFTVKKYDNKADELASNTFSYTSHHYDLQHHKSNDEKRRGFVFELQLRTISQHAWANTAHELSYKPEIELPDKLKRKVYRLAALYEIADYELNSVNSYVASHKDFYLFQLFKVLEKNFYKLAKHPFDRTQSIIYIKNLLTFLKKEQLENLNTDLEFFLSENTKKISNIFSEYKNEPNYNFIILQPEIILTWFILSKYTYNLLDNWSNYFHPDDLVIIKLVWGELD